MSHLPGINLPEQIPLSDLQRRLWAGHRHAQGKIIQFVQLCMEIQGPLQVELLQSSLNLLISSHPVLRMRVVVVNGEPAQHVRNVSAIALPVIDLSHRAGDDLLAEARRRLQVWTRERFDPCEDTLVRPRLIRLAPEHYWLHLVAHLLICDELSLHAIAGELMSRYRSLAEGREPSPIIEPVSREILRSRHPPSSKSAAERAIYWRDYLADPSFLRAMARVETDLQHPLRGALKQAVIPPAIVEQLRAACRRWNITLKDVALAVFAAAMSQHAPEPEVLVSVVCDRPLFAGQPCQIGPLQDVLPLRVKVDPSEPFSRFLQQVKDSHHNALSNAPLPFEVLNDLSRNVKPFRFDPLTDLLFSYQVPPFVEEAAGAVRFRYIDNVAPFPRFDLECGVWERPGELKISLVYKAASFNDRWIQQLLDSYCKALSAAACGSDLQMRELLPGLEARGSQGTSTAYHTSAAAGAQSPAILEGIQRDLAELWLELLPGRTIGLNDNFFALGGDSILSVMLATKARRRGLIISPGQVFRYQTISSLAAVAVRESHAVGAPHREPSATAAGLTPIQQWWFERRRTGFSHFAHSVLLKAQAALSGRAVMVALRTVLSHHEALQLRFSHDNGQWHQILIRQDVSPCVCIELSDLPSDLQQATIASALCEVPASLDIGAGSLMQAVWFDLGEQHGQLLVTVHHLAVDAFSWRILIEDLELACVAAMQGVEPSLTPVMTSYCRWAQTLKEVAHSADVHADEAYWIDVLRTPGDLPVDFTHGPNVAASARTISVTFDSSTTRALLEKSAGAAESWIQHALIAAVARALQEWTGRNEIRIDVEGHGRHAVAPGVDVSRTVGWFTVLYPLRIQASRADPPERLLFATAEEMRTMPRAGISYGLLRYLEPEDGMRRRFAAASDSAACFNYLGQFDHLWSPSVLFRPLATRIFTDQNAERPYLLQIDALISNGELRVDWEYSENVHRQETMKSLSGRFRSVLLELLDSAPGRQDREPGEYRTFAGLDGKQLAHVVASLEAAEDN